MVENVDQDLLARTEAMISRLHIPEVPPSGFHALDAEDRELLRYGLPPSPDQKTHPLHYERWLRALGRPLHHITPTFRATDQIHLPDYVDHRIVENNTTSSTWSGGVVTSPPPGETFVT